MLKLLLMPLKLSQNIGKVINTNYNLLGLKAYDNNKNQVLYISKLSVKR